MKQVYATVVMQIVKFLDCILLQTTWTLVLYHLNYVYVSLCTFPYYDNYII